MLQTTLEPPPSLARVLTYRAETNKRHAQAALTRYRPYAKQREFHEAGMAYRERLFLAANQTGKTSAGASEIAMHLTGEYPSWWMGRRFEHPITALAGSESSELTRDGVQRLVLGPPANPDAWGTGTIPGTRLGTVNRRQGVANAVDTVSVHHKAGGQSVLQLKSYDQGRTKWQANTAHVVWFDEEPPEDIYLEGLTRTNATGGLVFLTFTPLKGVSRVVRRFRDASPDRHSTTMDIDEAEHFTPEERARIIASYPEHERDARTRGIPMRGSGVVYPVPEDSITVDAFAIPRTWAQIGGLDFGWDHPFAAVALAHDRDTDTVYVTKAYRVREKTPIFHAAALKPWNAWMPWAWPHDGLQHDKGSGVPLARQYEAQGLRMLPERATFDDGGFGVDAGVMAILDRMESGRFKVFRHLVDWFEEFRDYHRKDGVIVKEQDDLLDCTRYAVMTLRFATPEPTLVARRKVEKWWA